MLADGLEELADEALRRPVGETDLATGLADAESSARGPILIGSEHHAEGRNDGVEAGVGKRQRLRIGLAKFDVEPVRPGAFPRTLKQRRDIVGRNHLAPAARGCQGDIAVAGGDVEHLLPGAEVEGLAQFLADDLQGGADDGIVAGGPSALLARFEGLEINRRGSGGLDGGSGGFGHDPYSFGRFSCYAVALPVARATAMSRAPRAP